MPQQKTAFMIALFWFAQSANSDFKDF